MGVLAGFGGVSAGFGGVRAVPGGGSAGSGAGWDGFGGPGWGWVMFGTGRVGPFRVSGLWGLGSLRWCPGVLVRVVFCW